MHIAFFGSFFGVIGERLLAFRGVCCNVALTSFCNEIFSELIRLFGEALLCFAGLFSAFRISAFTLLFFGDVLPSLVLAVALSRGGLEMPLSRGMPLSTLLGEMERFGALAAPMKLSVLLSPFTGELALSGALRCGFGVFASASRVA